MHSQRYRSIMTNQHKCVPKSQISEIVVVSWIKKLLPSDPSWLISFYGTPPLRLGGIAIVFINQEIDYLINQLNEKQAHWQLDRMLPVLSEDLTTTPLMWWWTASRSTWASGIQLGRKTTTGSAHCPTHRRYIFSHTRTHTHARTLNLKK